MTELPIAETLSFAGVAKQVQRRLILRKGLLFLLKTWPYVAGLLAALIVARLCGASLATPLAGLGLLALWILASFVMALRLAASEYSALSFWDEAAGRSDDFANAWWFERLEKPDEGQRWHIGRQAAMLPVALPQLKRDVPLPDVRWLLLLPVTALAIVLLPHGEGLRLPDAALSDADRKVANEEARRLEDKKLDADKLKGITEEEKKEIEKLQNKIQETAKSLEQDGAKTARQVLAELEKRASDAERMASKLGAGDAAWASDQMIAEMRKHTDTADLGDAAANKSAESTAKRAEEIATKLKAPDLSSDMRDRLSETLRDISKQAQAEDKERTVGQHVLGAERDLAQSLPKEAGQEFQNLADKMKILAQREKAREELEKLADQLRESAGNIAGQGSQGMQQLAGNSSQQSAQGQSGQAQQQGQQMMTMQNAQQAQPMQAPSFSNAQQAQGQQGPAQQLQGVTPAPAGTKGKDLAVAPPGSKPGDKKDKDDKPKLFAPIPGQPEGDPDAAIIMPGAGNGIQAGNGVAQMESKTTAPSKADRQGVVNASRNEDGTSSVRSIEGRIREEQASRSTQATALESITAEQNALDEAALPPARREQVRRYFSELRKRFEQSH
jgi:hypothetical protein